VFSSVSTQHLQVASAPEAPSLLLLRLLLLLSVTARAVDASRRLFLLAFVPLFPVCNFGQQLGRPFLYSWIVCEMLLAVRCLPRSHPTPSMHPHVGATASRHAGQGSVVLMYVCVDNHCVDRCCTRCAACLATGARQASASNIHVSAKLAWLYTSPDSGCASMAAATSSTPPPVGNAGAGAAHARTPTGWVGETAHSEQRRQQQHGAHSRCMPRVPWLWPPPPREASRQAGRQGGREGGREGACLRRPPVR
jgi:hypothetical protein